MAPANAASRERNKYKEYDDAKRKAKVFLYTRPIKVLDKQNVVCQGVHYDHWALVFQFKGGDTRTAEGLPDKGRKLRPKYTKQLPPKHSKGKYRVVCDRMKCSPANVLAATKSNKLNGSDYSGPFKNCQNWIKFAPVPASKMALAEASTPSGDDKDMEFDFRKREVEVLLYTHPIKFLEDGEHLFPDAHYQHWALVFKFNGKDIRTVEGAPDKNQKLRLSYTKQLPPVQKGQMRYDICKMVCSPVDVLKAAQANRLNGKHYSVPFQNCQNWAKELAYTMGGELAKNIDKHATLGEYGTAVAVVGACKAVVELGAFSSTHCS